MTNTRQQQWADVQKWLNYAQNENSTKAYDVDFRLFNEWCVEQQLVPLPASVETVMLYLNAHVEQYRLSTLRRKLSSISKAHQTKGLHNPTKDEKVRMMMDGISRYKGTRQAGKRALLVDDIKRLVDVIDTTTLKGVRDKALILLGFALASRRSELVAIRVEDLTFHPEGLEVFVQQTKTGDYDLLKTVVRTETDLCPVVAVERWLAASHITSGAIFRSVNKHGKLLAPTTDKTVARIIKQYAELASMDVELYSGHSLRSGLATSASLAGLSDNAIMKQTGHKTRQMVDRYIQNARRFDNNASRILG